MFRVCGWCGIFMGLQPPLASATVTHGICPPCSERVHRQAAPHLRRALIVVHPRQRDLYAHLRGAFEYLPNVAVIFDRREGERRRDRALVGTDRRQRDRRRPLLPTQRRFWRLFGIYVVQ
ncbi:MAG: hypothetical protein HY002_03325 [Candidatus Rokubacteria bacterium]|nr:hypothetical protein [Candidatus Rokubacteria bacterium]